jgi:hypothetical protein
MAVMLKGADGEGIYEPKRRNGFKTTNVHEIRACMVE